MIVKTQFQLLATILNLQGYRAAHISLNRYAYCVTQIEILMNTANDD